MPPASPREPRLTVTKSVLGGALWKLTLILRSSVSVAGYFRASRAVARTVGMVRGLMVGTLAASLLLVSACAGTRGGSIPYDVQDFGPPDRQPALTVADDYRIAPLDTLGVTVYPVNELTREVQVDLRGRISMPLIGDVQAIDLTTDELEKVLIQRFSAKYLNAPQVDVAIKASTRSSVTLDGAISSPGIYPLAGPMTLVQAVAMGKGTTGSANPKRVAIFRQIEGKRMAAAFDLTSIRRGEAEDPKIYGGDIILIDGSEVKQAQRELLQALPLIRFFLY